MKIGCKNLSYQSFFKTSIILDMPYSGSMVILSNVDNFRNVTTKALSGKPGQLKCFQKRQNKCKCHVRLEGADLLSLYNRNLKSLFFNTGFNF